MLGQRPLNSGKQGNRSGNRLKLALAGQLELTTGTIGCTVENVSRTGARLVIASPPSRGCPVILHVAERRMFAIVTWTRSGQCALRFDDPVSLEDMQRLLWITENREQYERERQSSAAKEWSVGLGDGSLAARAIIRSTSPGQRERRRVPRPARRSA